MWLIVVFRHQSVMYLLSYVGPSKLLVPEGLKLKKECLCYGSRLVRERLSSEYDDGIMSIPIPLTSWLYGGGGMPHEVLHSACGKGDLSQSWETRFLCVKNVEIRSIWGLGAVFDSIITRSSITFWMIFIPLEAKGLITRYFRGVLTDVPQLKKALHFFRSFVVCSRQFGIGVRRSRSSLRRKSTPESICRGFSS